MIEPFVPVTHTAMGKQWNVYARPSKKPLRPAAPLPPINPAIGKPDGKGGYMFSDELSAILREAVAPLAGFRHFCDVEDLKQQQRRAWWAARSGRWWRRKVEKQRRAIRRFNAANEILFQ